MAAAPTLAETVVAAFKRHGVKRMFGIPGGGSSLDLIDAAGAAGVEFVLTRTETAAAFMAAVTGELSSTPGVVLTGIGPGAASAVNGIAYAKLERAPVVLITDGPASSLHQAFDQPALFAPITKAQGRLRPEDGAAAIERAIATALTSPWGPVQLDLTAPDAMASVTAAAPDAGGAPVSATVDAKTLERARGMLAASSRPVILAGLEARHGDAPAALRTLVDALACPALATYKAKGVLADAHPCAVGIVTGAAAEADCIGRADLIVCFGLDPVELIPGKWRYKAPILELRAAPGAVLPATSACRVVAPLADAVAALLPVDASGWTADEIAVLRDAMRARIAIRGSGHTADSVTAALAKAAPAGTRLTVDAGAHMFSVFALWPAQEPFGVLKSNGLSTMGFALPAAIASVLHEPQRPVAAVTGDGGLLMCLAELTTAVERRCRIVVVVINDSALSLIDIKQQRQQRKSRGVRYPTVDFAGVAEALGCRAWRVGAGEALEPALEQAFAGNGPALIDVIVDPSGYGDQLVALRG